MLAQHVEDGAALFRAALPAGRFRDVPTDIEHQEGRCGADHEQPAPADMGIEQAVDDRGEEEAGRIARLQQARDQPARLGRDRFHGERRADAPFAAHGDTEEGAQDQQRREIGREAGSEIEYRVEDDVDHQGRPPPEMIGRPAEDQRTERAHAQGQRDGERDEPVGRVELLLDIAEHEDHQEEIERIQRPAEKAGSDDVSLFLGPAGKRFNRH